MLFFFHNPPLWLLALLLLIPLSIPLAVRGIYLLVKRHYKGIERKLAIGLLTVVVICVGFQLILPNDANPVVVLSIPFGILASLLFPLFSENYNGFLITVPVLLGTILNFSAILAIVDFFLRFIRPYLTSASE